MSKKMKKYLNEKFDTINSRYTTDMELLRQAIIEEYNAINIYKSMALKCSNAELKRTFLHVAEEEMHHVHEFELLLKKIDPEFAEKEAESKEELKELGINT